MNTLFRKNKNIGLVAGVAIFSSLFTIIAYKFFEKPKEILLNADGSTARFASYTDALFSGKIQRSAFSSSPNNFTTAAATVTPAVVNIKSLQSAEVNVFGEETLSASSGSGVVISPEGYIVTNNHVVDNSTNIEVTLNDHRTLKAKLIGTDPSTDLALIKIETEKRMPYLIFGNSDSLRVGEWVLAVGNPFNLESTVTAGIVSAKGRNIDILEDATSIESFIQTDAVVNPGNSGGALVNTNGELVGINTAIITKSGRYEGYSFAVPSNLAQKVIKDLKEYGVVQRGFLNVEIKNLDEDRAKTLGLSTLNGIYISKVYDNGAAQEAGMKRGDVVTAVNGIEVKSIPEFQEQIGRFRPGNNVMISYIRDGKNVQAAAVLKNKSNTSTTVTLTESKLFQKLGFEIKDLTPVEVSRMRVRGAKVASITYGGKIARTNMDPGFIITKINDKTVTNTDDVLRELEKQPEGKKVMLEGIYEDFEGEYYYAFPM